MAQPDADRGDVDGSLVDALALVVAGGHGPELFQLAEAALDGVALLVPAGVEDGRAASGTAAVAAVFLLVFLDGNDGRDVVAAQPGAARRSQARFAREEYALSAIARPGRR